MKLSKLVGERIREIPSSVTVKSQEFMIRAGYIKQLSSGIYSLLPPAQRVLLNIQRIIREEMEGVDGQEVLFPVVMPRELWEESGRYSSIGEEMVRFKDRSGHDMLLGMTHEEAAVHMAKNTVKSYEQLPFSIFQIQTKFRDEARPRAGLIRVREFTMKDSYSFHENQACLEKYYALVHAAYKRIFKRMGMKNVISVSSDTGMMGGRVAHEFMLLTPIGEDSLVLCDTCDYRANQEVAKGILDKLGGGELPLEEVYTGNAKTIEEVADFFNIEKQRIVKSVCYAVPGDSSMTVIVFIRGDLEVNEAKLRNFLKMDVAPKDLSDSLLVAGNIGCFNLPKGLTVIYDESLRSEMGLVTGANKEEYHIKNLSFKRDIKVKEFIDVAKVKSGEKCACCGGTLRIERGIEVGNIFQLGTKYTGSMQMKVTGSDGKEFSPIMGCYGIGLGRCAAAVAEESCDEKGLVWPIAIAPWKIYLCPLRLDNKEVLSQTEEIYRELSKKGISALYDDRNATAGVKFSDSELMGIPIRVVISPRSLERKEAEVVIRKTGKKIMVPLNELLATIENLIVAE